MNERRSFPRIPHAFDGQFRQAGVFTELWNPMSVMNLSANGVRFRTDLPLEAAMILDLKCHVPGLQRALEVQGRVVWTAMPAAGVIETGVEFLDLSQEQKSVIDRLVAFLHAEVQPEPAPIKKAEQRRFDRVPEVFNVRCRDYGALSEGWRLVYTMDVSAGGIGFQTADLFYEGQMLEIQITLPSFRAPLSLRGVVVRCRPVAGAYDCATEFVNVSPDQQAAIDTLVQFLRRRP